MKQADPAIRIAEPGAAAVIAELHVAGWRETYRGLMPEALLDGLSVVRRAEMWRLLLAETGKRVWLADDGFCAVGPDRTAPGEGELYALYVRKAAWGGGLGALLWRAAEAWLAEQRYPAVRLWVLSENLRARRFYEKMGFSLAGERDEILGGVAIKELAYRKALGAPRQDASSRASRRRRRRTPRDRGVASVLLRRHFA